MICRYAVEAALIARIHTHPLPPPPPPENMAKLTSQEESIAAETEALESRLADLSGDVSRQVGVSHCQDPPH